MKLSFGTVTLEDKQYIREIWEEGFPNDTKEQVDWHFEHRFVPEKTFAAWNEEGIIVCCLQIAPYKVNIKGEIFDANYVIGAVTKEKFRSQGHMHALMKYVFLQLKESQQAIAMLYPVNYGFYRTMGFEVCSDRIRYSLTTKNIQHEMASNCFICEFMPLDVLNMKKTFDSMMARFSVHMVRDEHIIKLRLDEWLASGGKTLYASLPDSCAYALYHIEDGSLRVSELVYTSMNSLRCLLVDLATKAERNDIKKISFSLPICDSLHNLLSDGRRKGYLEPFAMMRVVDVRDLLSSVRLLDAKGIMNIGIIDDFCQWNNGTFELQLGEAIRCNPTDKAPDFTCTITTITRVLSGAVSIQDALLLGDIVLTNPQNNVLRWKLNCMKRQSVGDNCIFDLF